MAKISTVAGSLMACSVDEGICLIEFSEGTLSKAGLKYLEKYFPGEIRQGENKHLVELRAQLKEYFDGSGKEFTVPLVLRGTPFQVSVWNELLNIKYGTTRSYIGQANALGMSTSVRAVANANGQNHILILIPCHRVIGSDGSLTGYSGGRERKNWLIEHEKKYSGREYELTVF